MTHIYYGAENEGLRLSLWAVWAGSSFSTPKSAVAELSSLFVMLWYMHKIQSTGTKKVYHSCHLALT